MELSFDSFVGKHIYVLCGWFVELGKPVRLRRVVLHAVEQSGLWIEDADDPPLFPGSDSNPVFIPFQYLPLVAPLTADPPGPVLVFRPPSHPVATPGR